MTEQEPQAPDSENTELQVEEVEIETPGELPPKVLGDLVDAQRKYSLVGLVLGSIVIVVGAVLVVLGFTESVDITFESGGSRGHVVTGSLGTVLALIGLAIVYFTRLKVKIKSGK